MMAAPASEPFTSGLPGPELVAAAPDPRGLAKLMRLRARAEDDMRIHEPLTRRRFDGAEVLEPDEFSIEEYDRAALIKQLIDAILAEREMCIELCRVLGGGRPR